MNQKLLGTLAFLALATTPVLAQGDDDAPQGRRAPSPMRAEMEKVEEALDVVAEYVEKFEGDAPMAELDAALKGLQEAKQHTPRTAARQPEEQRAAYVVAFRVQINKTIRAMLDLEDAIVEQDKGKAQKALKTLEQLQKDGHEKYKPRRRGRGQRGGAGGEGAPPQQGGGVRRRGGGGGER